MTDVILSPAAKRNLENIGDYIAKDNPRAARNFVRQMQSRCALLRTTPWLGRARPDLGPDIHSFTYGSYLVLYRYRKNQNRIDILHFWHGRRLPPDIAE